MDSSIALPDETKDTIVTMVFGSHLYGLNTPASDFDFKSIFLPTVEQLVLNDYKKEYAISTGDEHSKNGSDDLDISKCSLQHFIDNCISGQTWALDMLHANDEHLIISSPVWRRIQANRSKFYTKDLNSFVGYVKTQASKYGIKGSRLSAMRQTIDTLLYHLNVTKELHGFKASETLIIANIWDHLPESEYLVKLCNDPVDNHPSFNYYEVCGKKYQSTNLVTYVLERIQKSYDSYGHRAKLAEQNEGIDWKAISHAFRAGYQAKEIYETGTITYPLSMREKLVDIKLGRLDYKKQVEPELEALVEEVDSLAAKSNLPDKVDVYFWKNFVLDVYEEYYQIREPVRPTDGVKIRSTKWLMDMYK